MSRECELLGLPNVKPANTPLKGSQADLKHLIKPPLEEKKTTSDSGKQRQAGTQAHLPFSVHALYCGGIQSTPHK